VKRLDPFALPLSGTHLIEASAGTGKTHTISNLYLRLLLEGELEVGRILVVTYTNAATAELRGRIRDRIKQVRDALAAGASADERDAELEAWVRLRREGTRRGLDLQRLEAALHNFDDAAIFTIHGFCQRGLHENAFESGSPFDVELVSDQTLILDRVVRDFWVTRLAGAEEAAVDAALDGLDLADLMTLARKAALHRDVPVLPEVADPTDAALALQREFVDYVRLESQRHKREANVQFFDDLLHGLARSLRGPGGEQLAERVAERFRAALVDEFQDTDPVQYEIFRRVFTRRPLFLIGDPKQAIYGFRGADVFTYLEARGATGAGAGRSEHQLDVNWRSDPGLLRAVNAIFGAGERPFLFDGIEYAAASARTGAADQLSGPRSAPFQFLFCDTGPGKAPGKAACEGRVARAVAADIARFLAERPQIAGKPVRPSDIAVLCRTNDQAALVQDELRRFAVPSVLQGDRSVLDTAEAEEVGRVLAAIADPARADAVRAALATPLFGFDAAQLVKLRADEAEWDRHVERMQAWRDTWLAHGFTPAFRQMLDEGGVTARLLALPDGERRLTNVLHLGELLQNAAAETRRRPLALVEWLALVRLDENLRRDAVGEAAQIRLESDDDALTLTTVHRAKGLQYPIVYCPFLWCDFGVRPKEAGLLFHDPHNNHRLTLDVGSERRDEHLAQAEREVLAENLRILYVALTRARHRCTVVWGRFANAAESALAYLLHRPPAPGADLAAEVAERVKNLSSDGMRSDLERLAARAAGAIVVDDLIEDAGGQAPPWQGERPSAQPGPARTFGRERLHVTLRTSSYSDLTRAAHAAAEQAADHDEGESEQAEQAIAETVAAPRIVLADFPRGAAPGTMIHSVFEHLDFCEREPAHLRQTIRDAALRSSLAAEHLTALEAAVRDVLDAPFGPREAPIVLSSVPRHERLNEMPFLLAVAGGGTAAEAFTVEELAGCFAAHGHAAYAARVRELGFAPLRGFLTGVVDLVFRHRRRWYVVDYKSTFLGVLPGDYRPEYLAAPMADEHYILQYHLYAVALHRYLEARLPGYDYERDFGGVFYLFVRGMSPRYEYGNGVFADRPPLKLVESLARLFQGPAPVQE